MRLLVRVNVQMRMEALGILHQLARDRASASAMAEREGLTGLSFVRACYLNMHCIHFQCPSMLDNQSHRRSRTRVHAIAISLPYVAVFWNRVSLLSMVQIMTVIVELMSNDIGRTDQQKRGQESLEALSAVYDWLDSRGDAAGAAAVGPRPGPLPAPHRVRA